MGGGSSPFIGKEPSFRLSLRLSLARPPDWSNSEKLTGVMGDLGVLSPDCDVEVKGDVLSNFSLDLVAQLFRLGELLEFDWSMAADALYTA